MYLLHTSYFIPHTSHLKKMFLKSALTHNFVEAGLDEVGRGCLAGPVVAAAVILPKNYKNAILNDSKQLSKEDRNALEISIKNDALAWAIAEVSHTEIDRINILRASFLAMHKALDAIFEQFDNKIIDVVPEILLVDGNRFTPYNFLPYNCIVKGDAKFASIAAASVLAKTYRDALMEGLALQYPLYGWEQNMGYPTIEHRKAVLLHGFSPLHRLTFKVQVGEEEV